MHRIAAGCHADGAILIANWVGRRIDQNGQRPLRQLPAARNKALEPFSLALPLICRLWFCFSTSLLSHTHVESVAHGTCQATPHQIYINIAQCLQNSRIALSSHAIRCYFVFLILLFIFHTSVRRCVLVFLFAQWALPKAQFYNYTDIVPFLPWIRVRAALLTTTHCIAIKGGQWAKKKCWINFLRSPKKAATRNHLITYNYRMR